VLPAILGELSVSGIAGLASQFDNPEQSLIYLETPVSGVTRDSTLALGLWEGAAAFQAGFQTGGFSLSGKETALASCGICVSVKGGGLEAPELYLPYFGYAVVRELDAVAGGRIRIDFEDLRLRQVTLDALGNQSDLEDGCLAAIDSVHVDVTLIE